jgi:multiple sugar transport system substrate-binding protein
VVKDFWSVPSYPRLLEQLNARLGPYVIEGEGNAQQALDALARDWSATLAGDECN